MQVAQGSPAGDVGVAAHDVAATSARRTIRAICGMLYYQGFTMAINGIGAPWIAKSFGLDESGVAGLYAWISFSSIGALILSRMADRVGRRRVLLWCMTATPLCALGAAASFSKTVFALFEIPLYAFIGATVSCSVVMLAEALPVAQRAKGQSYGGLAVTLGGGLCVILMPLVVGAGYSWRWLLVLSGVGLLGVPRITRALPESQRWERAAASGATGQSAFYDVFGPRYRGRAVPILICFLLSTIASTAATSWGYFHAVSVVGLSAGAASTMMLVGGGVSMLGFVLGAWGAERFGRVPTIVSFGLMVAGGTLFFYWGPPAGFAHPGLWLGAGFCWFSAAMNGAMVGGNSVATELFPTALRGTMIGWFALMGAVASVTAQTAIALLAQPLGGLSVVVGYLGLLTIPSAIIFGSFIEETRGLSLDVAAGEDLDRA
jgi:MFS family permease